MGLILDSSVIIAGERRGHNVEQILEEIQDIHGEVEIGISAVTIVELTHGIFRAKTEERRQRRQSFVDELCRDVPVHPVMLQTAKLAGQIQGQQAEQGVNIPFEDLLVGVTALQLGFGVATANIRHFQLIPALPWCNSEVRSCSLPPLAATITAQMLERSRTERATQ